MAGATPPKSSVFIFPENGKFPQDDKTLRRMATEIHAKIGHPQTAMTSSDKHDQQVETWVANLSTSLSGQKLLDHLSHMEAAPHIKTSSAIEQASSFRRVFVYALSKRVNPFGLPKKLPKYIAISNFSGDRLMVYSSRPELISFLTLGSSGSLHSCSIGVNDILAHAAQNENTSVVLYYSLPFQMGYDAAHWECRTLVRNADGSVNDGDLVCCSWSADARPGSLTMQVEAQRADILDEQVVAFGNYIKASDLDFMVERVDGIDPAYVTDGQNAKLLKLISVLKTERRNMIAEHRQELEELKIKHKHNLDNVSNVYKDSVDQQKMEEGAALKQCCELQDTIEQLKASLKAKHDENQHMKSELMLKEETLQKSDQEFREKLADVSKENDVLKNNAKRAEIGHGDALQKQKIVHQRMHDEAERKLQKAKQYESMANDAAARAQIVEQAFERVSNEKTFADSEVKTLKKRVSLLNIRTAFMIGRCHTFRSMLSEARMKHVEAAEALSKIRQSKNEDCQSITRENDALKQTISELQETMQKKEEEANEKICGLNVQLHDIKIQLSDPPVSEDVSTSVTGNERSVDTIAIQTDILPETLKIGELESESVKLQDEIIHLKTELGRAKLRNAKRNSTTSNSVPNPNQPEENISNVNQTASLVQPNGMLSPDPVLEGTIQQLQTSLNTVTELARQCNHYEQSARDAWAKLNVYENMNVYHHSYAQQAPLHMMQHHSQTQHYPYVHGMYSS